MAGRLGGARVAADRRAHLLPVPLHVASDVQAGRLVVAGHPRGGPQETAAVGDRPEAAAAEREEDPALGRHHQGRPNPQHQAHDGTGGRPEEAYREPEGNHDYSRASQ